MGHSQPEPPADVTNLYLGSMFGMFPQAPNRDGVDGQTFTAVVAFTDPGIRAQTIHVADGAATVVPGTSSGADLVVTQSAETWEKTFRGIISFPEALKFASVEVNDCKALETFGTLFPMENPEHTTN